MQIQIQLNILQRSYPIATYWGSGQWILADWSADDEDDHDDDNHGCNDDDDADHGCNYDDDANDDKADGPAFKIRGIAGGASWSVNDALSTACPLSLYHRQFWEYWYRS